MDVFTKDTMLSIEEVILPPFVAIHYKHNVEGPILDALFSCMQSHNMCLMDCMTREGILGNMKIRRQYGPSICVIVVVLCRINHIYVASFLKHMRSHA